MEDTSCLGSVFRTWASSAPGPLPANLALTLFFALIGLCVVVLGTALSPALAQYPGGGYPGASATWIACDSSGNPLQVGSPGLNSDGSAALLGTGKQQTADNTYPIPKTGAPSWWYGAYSPQVNTAGSGYPGSGLYTASNANNSVTGQTGGISTIGYYDPVYFSGDRPGNTPTPPDLNGTVTTSNSDALTAYFVWTGTLPTPTPVTFIIRTTASASASVNYGNSGRTSGLSSQSTASLGISNASATAGDAGLIGSQSVVGYQTTLVTPSGKIAKVSMTGSVSTTSTNSLRYATWTGTATKYYNGPGAGQTSASANASVSAAAYPTLLSLGGGIGPSNAKHLLIGQQLNASLNTGPLTASSWNWTVSGGSPFKNWSASNASAVYTPLGSETGNTLVCYFAKPEPSATVSCKAHLTVPAGSSPSSGIDVTETQTLAVEKPSAQLSIAIGSVTDLPSPTNPSYVQLQRVYRYPPDGNANGITWNGLITTPAAYVTSGAYGSWNWTQLISASRQQKNSGVYWQFAVDTTTPPTIINGLQILDGMYPYGYFWYSANGATPAPGNADSPGQPLDASNAIREYDVSDSFKDYLMYQPPGTNSLPVPLQENDWYWQFQALKNASNAWNTSGKNAQWGYVSDFPAFPVWTFYAPVGHLTFASP